MEVAIISGKGGSGKSSISAAFATLSERLVLADCDVDAANLFLLFDPRHEEEVMFTGGEKAVIDHAACTLCGQCIPYCRFDAISYSANGVSISETACDGCHLCIRICPHAAIAMVSNRESRLYSGSFRNGRMVYGRLAPGEENSGKLVSLVREKAREQSKQHGLDTIIIDGPPGIGCPVIASITGVHQVIIVTEPSLSGLHDLQRAAEICSHFNIMTKVIINKSDLNEQTTLEIQNWCLSNELDVLRCLPFDPAMVEAMVNCQSIYEWAPHSSSARMLMKAWASINQNKQKK